MYTVEANFAENCSFRGTIRAEFPFCNVCFRRFTTLQGPPTRLGVSPAFFCLPWSEKGSVISSQGSVLIPTDLPGLGPIEVALKGNRPLELGAATSYPLQYFPCDFVVRWRLISVEGSAMGLLSKYQLLQMLRDDETKSYMAEETATHRPVIVHKVFGELRPPHEPDIPSLVFAFLRNASAEESRLFIDMGRDEGRVCIITAYEPQCLDLRQWLQSVAQAGAASVQAPRPPARATVPEASGPAENAMDKTMALGSFREPAPVEMPPEAPPIPEPPAVAAQEASGFTQAFFTVRSTDKPAAAPPPAPEMPSPRAPAMESKPGSRYPFDPAPPPAAPESKGLGEFTKAFFAKDVLAAGAGDLETPPDGTPLIPSAPAADFLSKPSAPPPPPPSSSATPGSFTQMFFAKDVLADGFGASNPAPEPSPLESTPVPSFPARPSPPPAAPSASKETGEFTKMFRAQDVLAQGGAPPGSVSADDFPFKSSPQAGPPASGADDFPFKSSPAPAAPGTGADDFPFKSSPSPSAPPSGAAEPGSFTQMFFAKDALPGSIGAPAPPSKASPSPVTPPKTAPPPPPPMARPASPAPVSPTESTSGGEFTRMFVRDEAGLGGSMPPPPPRPAAPAMTQEERTQAMRAPVPPAKPAPPTPAAPQASEAGEITRFLSRGEKPASSLEATQAVPPSLPPKMPPPPAASAKPGRFAAFEQDSGPVSEATVAIPSPRPGGSAPRPNVPPPPPSAPKGDFERLFQNSGGTPARASSTVSETSTPPSAPRPAAPPQNEPGEFTQMMKGYNPGKSVDPGPQFGDPQSQSPFPSSGAEPSQRGPGDFTRIFSAGPGAKAPAAPAGPAAPPSMIAPPAPVASPPPPASSGPGEYTRMFEISRKPAAPAASAAPPAGAPPAGAPFALPPITPPPAPAPPKFPAAPAAPAAPKFPAAPAAPAAPKAPAFPAPAMPPMAAPAAPAAPKLPAAPPAPAMPKAGPAAVPKKGPFLIVLIVLGCSFLAAVALILFFALRHH